MPLIEVGLSLLLDGLPVGVEELLIDLTAGTFGVLAVAEVLRWVGEAYVDQSIELENRERRFRSLVQSGPDAVVVVGADEVLDYVSPAYLALTGLTADDAIGGDPIALVHDADRDHVRDAWNDALAAPNVATRASARIRRADGSWRLCEIRLRSMLNDPAVAGMVLNIRDLTDERVVTHARGPRPLRDPHDLSAGISTVA